MDSQVAYGNAFGHDPETNRESRKGFKQRGDLIRLALEKDPSGSWWRTDWLWEDQKEKPVRRWMVEASARVG